MLTSPAGGGKEVEEADCSSASFLFFWACPSKMGTEEGWRRNNLQNKSMKILLFKVLVLYNLLTICFGNFNEFFPPTFTLFEEQKRERKSRRWKHALCVSFKNIVFHYNQLLSWTEDHKSLMQKSFTSINLIQIKFAKEVLKFWSPWLHPENLVVQMPLQVQTEYCDQNYHLSALKSQHFLMKVKKHFRQKEAKG